MGNPIDKGLIINVGLDDSKFSSGMKGISQKLRQAQSEFKATDAVIDKNSKSVKDLSARYNSFKKIVDVQRQKVEELKKTYEKNKEALENNEKATTKDREALLKQGQAYNNAIAQLARSEDKLKGYSNQVIKAGGYVGKFGSAITTTGTKVEGLGNKLKSAGDRTSEFGSKMTAFASVPIAGAMGAAAKSAVTFGDEMTKMQAVSGATKKDMDALKSASLESAKAYGVSTGEYNAAATELLKSGYSTKESTSIMSAGIKTAKATGEDLETVLDKTSNTMKIFGYSANDAGKVTDKLAYVANASKSSVQELGDGLTKVGPVANSLGINLDTTASALGVLQDRGFKVEEAATGLKSGLSNLVNPSKANAQAFERLGINMADIKKNGVNLPQILNSMTVATQGMTKSQKEALISQAFGKESMAQWTALMSGPAQEALAKYTKGSKEATGSVDELWKKMKESPKQKIDELKGSFQTLAITFGEKVLPVVLPVLNDVTKSINSMIEKFSSLSPKTQDFIVKAGMMAVALGPAVTIAGKFTKGIGSLIGGFGKVTKGVGGFVGSIGSFITKCRLGESAVWNFTKKLGGIAGKGVKNAFTYLWDGFKSIGTVTKDVGGSVWKFSKNLAGIAGKGVKSALSYIGNGFKSIWTVSKDAAGSVGKFGVKIKNIAVAGGKQALESLKSGFSSIKTIAIEAGTKVGEVSKKIIAFGSEKVKNGFNSVKTGLSNVKTKGKEASDKVAGITSKITAWTSDKVKLAFTSLKMNLSKVKEKAGEVSSKLSGIFTNIKAKGNDSFFSGLMSSLTGLISKSSFATKAMRGLSVAFSVMTGPVGIAVGAIALIGGAFVLAYKKCKPFRDFINRIGSWFKEKFDVAIKWAKDFGKRLVDNVVNKSVNPISVAVKGWKIAKYFKGRFDKARKEGDSFGTALKKAMGDTIGNISSKVKNWKIVKWFSDKWSSVKQKTADFKENLGTKFNELKGSLSEKIKNWSIVKWFSDKWSSVKSKTETFKKEMGEKISDLVENIANTVKKSKIGKAFSEAFNKAKELVAKPVNGIIHGANWVIHKLGGPEKTIDDWNPNKYAKGTQKGGHPGGLAMVNDEKGATYREAVTLPNGRTFIPNGRNVVMNLPKGTQVANAKTTRNALNSGILRYKDGTDESWLSKAWNFGKKAVSKIGDVIGDVMDYATNPGKLVRKVMENFVNFGKLLDFPLDLGKGILRKGIQALTNKVKAMFEEMESDDGGSFGGHGDLGSNKWFQIHGNWVREWQYRLLEPIIKQYHFRVTDGGRRTWDNYDHSKGRAMDIAIGGNPLDIYWKVAQQIDKMPFVKYVNSNLKSTITGKWAPSNLEPRADHIHVSFTKELLSAKELKASSGNAGGSAKNPGGSGVQRWRPYVIKALKANGLPTTPEYVNAWLRQIQSESGGNPNAVQHGYVDINTLTGNLARGLLQVIPPTFAAHKFPGHGNIMNGYDNMLAAIHYAKVRYGARGMLNYIGHGLGYEKGGLVTTHQIAQIAEGNKPEMVIPLTNKSRSVQLINKARKLIGEDDIQTDTSELREQNRELKAMNEKLSSMIDLLGALLSKDNNIYMDGREFARVGAKPIQNEVNRMNINQNRLRGIG